MFSCAFLASFWVDYFRGRLFVQLCPRPHRAALPLRVRTMVGGFSKSFACAVVCCVHFCADFMAWGLPGSVAQLCPPTCSRRLPPACARPRLDGFRCRLRILLSTPCVALRRVMARRRSRPVVCIVLPASCSPNSRRFSNLLFASVVSGQWKALGDLGGHLVKNWHKMKTNQKIKSTCWFF